MTITKIENQAITVENAGNLSQKLYNNKDFRLKKKLDILQNQMNKDKRTSRTLEFKILKEKRFMKKVKVLWKKRQAHADRRLAIAEKELAFQVEEGKKIKKLLELQKIELGL